VDSHGIDGHTVHGLIGPRVDDVAGQESYWSLWEPRSWLAVGRGRVLVGRGVAVGVGIDVFVLTGVVLAEPPPTRGYPPFA